jgi:hypothetical protein
MLQGKSYQYCAQQVAAALRVTTIHRLSKWHVKTMEALGCCLLVQGLSGPQQVEHSIQIHAFSLIVPNPEASVSKAGAMGQDPPGPGTRFG